MSRSRLFAAFALLQTALFGPMAGYERRMKAGGGPGIIPFELAGSPEAAERIMEQWGEDGRAAARESLRLDFLFLCAYTGLNVLGCAWARDQLDDRGWSSLADAGAVVVPGQLVAGACDAVENASLLGVLAGRSDRLPAVARAFALGKFAVLLVGWSYAVAGVVARMTR